MEDEIMISIADFSKYPSGRDTQDGSFNGKTYREEILKPALNQAIQKKRTILVSLKGVMSFGSSFLEEAFGGLVREEGFTKEQLRTRLVIDPGKPNFTRYEKTIWSYINGAKKK